MNARLIDEEDVLLHHIPKQMTKDFRELRDWFEGEENRDFWAENHERVLSGKLKIFRLNDVRHESGCLFNLVYSVLVLNPRFFSVFLDFDLSTVLYVGNRGKINGSQRCVLESNGYGICEDHAYKYVPKGMLRVEFPKNGKHGILELQDESGAKLMGLFFLFGNLSIAEQEILATV